MIIMILMLMIGDDDNDSDVDDDNCDSEFRRRRREYYPLYFDECYISIIISLLSSHYVTSSAICNRVDKYV